MANYTKTTNFTAKDSLVSGDTNKRIRGSEIDTELSNIQTAVNSKLDSSSFTATNISSGTLAIAYGGTGSSSTTYCNLTTNVTGTLPVARGGTGLSAIGGANTLLYTTVPDTIAALASVNTAVLTTNSSGGLVYAAGTTPARVLRTNGSSISFAQVDVSTDVTGTLALANGGTGGTDAATARTSLDVPANDGTGASGTWNIAISGNAATATAASTYAGTINVGTQSTGVLNIANGGTGQSTAANAANALGVPGAGQTWQSTVGSRLINTDYQNTTGRPICVSVTLSTVTAGANNPRFWVSTSTPATAGVTVAYFSNGTTGNIDACVGPVIVPNNAYYRVQAAAGTSITFWAELR
jgi:hypothetical protein